MNLETLSLSSPASAPDAVTSGVPDCSICIAAAAVMLLTVLPFVS